MGKRFYIIMISLLSCSVLLLGLSYSKNSNDNTETNILDNSNNNVRVIYSTDKELGTIKDNTLSINIINKKNTNTNYALYLKEIDNKNYESVYYSINGGEEYLLTDGIIYLGELNKYGSNGDAKQYTITLRSINNYSFYYSIGEYTFLDEVSYGS